MTEHEGFINTNHLDLSDDTDDSIPESEEIGFAETDFTLSPRGREILEYRLHVLEQDEQNSIKDKNIDPDLVATDIHFALLQANSQRLLQPHEERDLLLAFPRIRSDIAVLREEREKERKESEREEEHSDGRSDTIKELERLQERIQHQILTRNLGLVVNEAKKRAPSGVEMVDLVQAGRMGILRTIEKFVYNPELKNRFSTYAVEWIRAYIGRSIANTARTIKIPVEIGALAYKADKVSKNLSVTLGREPLVEEVAQEIGVSPASIDHAWQAVRTQVSSLHDEVQLAEGAPIEVIHFIRDPEDLEETVEKRSLIEETRSLLQTAGLSDIQQRVIELRSGIGTNIPLDPTTVGRRLGISRQKVQKFEREGFLILKKEADERGLQIYLS